jgi:hypothetical protein
MVYEVCHAIPGRLRLKISLGQGEGGLFKDMVIPKKYLPSLAQKFFLTLPETDFLGNIRFSKIFLGFFTDQQSDISKRPPSSFRTTQVPRIEKNGLAILPY